MIPTLQLGQMGRRIVSGGPYLDQLAVAPAAFYGLAKCVSNAGRAIRVRRSSDNVEMDIGFAGDDLAVGVLLDFIAGATGTVTKFYNQMGNSQPDLVQATNTAQPRVVGSGVYEGEAAFNGTDYGMTAASFTFGTPQIGLYFKLRAPTPPSGTRIIVETNNVGTDFSLSHFMTTSTTANRSSNTGVDFRQRNYGAISSKTAQTLYTLLYDRSISGASEMVIYQAGSLQTASISEIATSEQTGNYASNNLNIGARNNGGTLSLFTEMGLKNLAVYNADTASIRASIEAIVNR